MSSFDDIFFCYPKPIEMCNKRTKSRKYLISYYKTNEISSLKNPHMLFSTKN
jgi:hypothetical protein